MRTITGTYSTGRTYDTAQQLEWTATIDQPDEWGFMNATIQFTDASRHITGTVQTLILSDAEIGLVLLAQYDAGNYT